MILTSREPRNSAPAMVTHRDKNPAKISLVEEIGPRTIRGGRIVERDSSHCKSSFLSTEKIFASSPESVGEFWFG